MYVRPAFGYQLAFAEGQWGSQRCGGPGGETVMGNVRRFVLLSVLALLIFAAAAVVMPKARRFPCTARALDTGWMRAR